MNIKDITIIILLYNTPEKALKEFANYKKFKIAILDQSNDLQTKRKLKKLLPNIVYYKVTNQNDGFAKGINFLVKKVKTKFFLCTQPDVKISVKSIYKLKKVFFKKKDAIISIPNLRSTKSFKHEFKEVKDFIGAIFLSEKKKFDKIKMFDPNFFFYWEDVDLSKRISLSKQKIYLNTKIFAKHNNGKSTFLNMKSLYIRTSNFKFGEYLFQYKNTQLRLIKVIREPIVNFLLLIFYILVLNKKKALIKFFTLSGIFNFFKFILIKKLK